MKRKIIPFLIALGLMILAMAGFFGIRLIERYTPSKELAVLPELFGVKGDQVSLILNEKIQSAQGIYMNGQTYLPIKWVNDNLNERFYWDNSEKLLIYTLPDKIVYADHNTMGSTGSPLIWVTGDEVYLSAGLVLNYTDMEVMAYDEGEVKRVYIDNQWVSRETAIMKKNAEARTLGDIKSPIVTTVAKNSQVRVIGTEGQWSEILTESGYMGYVKNSLLKGRVSSIPQSSFEEPEYTNISLPEPVRLVWHQVTTMDANNNMEKLISDTKDVNVIAPTWFALTDNNGNYNSLASKAYVDQAHALGIQVWALIDNFSKDVQSEVLLSSTQTRKKLIANLMEETVKYQLDGINLDFEGIKEEAGIHYLQFIRELSVSCRKAGIVLSIDNYVPAEHNEFYNRKEQGIVADYVIVMGYDEHYAGSEEAGSSASVGFVEQGIKDTLQSVPKEKLINAVPFYTRLWTENSEGISSTALGISKAKKWIEENKVELYWQEELGQYYGELDLEDGKQKIWMEEERSLGLKLKLIDEYELAGVACWKLGLEPSSVWDVIVPEDE